MEIFRFEGKGDYDEEESGPANREQPKKQPTPANNEGQYHSLRFVEPGRHELLDLQRQQAHSVLNELMKRPPEPEQSKEDDEDDEEDEEKEDTKNNQTVEESDSTEEPEAGITQPEASALVHDRTKESVAEHSPVHKAEPETPTNIPTHESLAEPGHEPEWLEEDHRESEKLLSKVFDKEHPAREAMSGALLKDTEPGQPPAIERTTNQNVGLQPEPSHRVEGFDSGGSGRQYEGYAPGPSRPVESSAPSFKEQVQSFEREFANNAQDRQNVPAPQDVIRPAVRESTADLSRKIEHMGLRQKEAITWLALIGSAGYLANRRNRRKIAQQEKELKKATKEYQEGTERLTLQQQAINQKVEAQAASMKAQYPAETGFGPNPEVPPASPQLAGYAEQVRPAPNVPEKPTISTARTGEDFTDYTKEYQPPPVAGTFQRERVGAGLPSAEGVSTPLINTEKQKAEQDAEAARRAIEDALAPQENPQEHKRVEQDAWLRHVIDERTGREVQGAVRHGHEYDEERSRETKPGAQHQQQPGRGAPGRPVFVGGGSDQAQRAQSAQDNHSLPDGQTHFDHSLPASMPALADLEHRLPEKGRNPIVEALTSPWLFLFLSLLLLAYFIATLF